MNDINSVLMATTILAVSGLGLYMYKTDSLIFNNDEDEHNDDDDDNMSENSDVSENSYM